MTDRSPTRHFDVIVVGAGAMGSAATYQLARRGRRVLALERFQVPHQMGSSHGLTRIIRLAFHEGPEYVPLGHRAYRLWRQLESESGQSLLSITGSVHAGQPGSVGFEKTLEACRRQGVEHEILTGAQLASRYPGYALPSGFKAVLQPQGGFLAPERCVRAHAGAARALGAAVHEGEQVLGWEAHSGFVRVSTDRATYDAGALVLTAGAWASKVLPELAGLAVPSRQVVAWFETRNPAWFRPSRFPVFILTIDGEEYYGFPDFEGAGFKIGKFDLASGPADPDALDRTWRPAEEEELRGIARRCFPDAAGRTLDVSVCMFTNSPDGHFVIGTDPRWPHVSFAAGFSGHGFKFASAIGEIMADLATRGCTDHDITLFDPTRFGAQSPSLSGN